MMAYGCVSRICVWAPMFGSPGWCRWGAAARLTKSAYPSKDKHARHVGCLSHHACNCSSSHTGCRLFLARMPPAYMRSRQTKNHAQPAQIRAPGRSSRLGAQMGILLTRLCVMQYHAQACNLSYIFFCLWPTCLTYFGIEDASQHWRVRLLLDNFLQCQTR